jgi:hypothetical protein
MAWMTLDDFMIYKTNKNEITVGLFSKYHKNDKNVQFFFIAYNFHNFL